MTTLQIIWFFLIGVLLIGYAILDGFDLGVGFWHLFAKKDKDRRILLNSVGPVWDGNEVWLLTGGGAIFAAFPPVYATVFSGFYLALMLLLAALIFRAVSLEFRSKVESARWRSTWDTAFSLGSIVAALLLGVALGNILRGIPLDDRGYYSGTFFGLLNPFALVIGLLGVSMFATHGALYIVLKAEGDLAEKAKGWAQKAWYAYIALFLVVSAWTITGQPHLMVNYTSGIGAVLFLIPGAALYSIIWCLLYTRREKPGKAFLMSSISIAALMMTAGFAIFPNIVTAPNDPTRNLSVYNASSSQYTLTVMLILALIGVPIVVGYTIFIYRVFRGKVKLGEHSY